MENLESPTLEFRVDDIYVSELVEGQFDVVYRSPGYSSIWGIRSGRSRAAARLAKSGGNSWLFGKLTGERFAAYPESQALDDFRREFMTRSQSATVAIRVLGGTCSDGCRILANWLTSTSPRVRGRFSKTAGGKTWWGDQWSQRILQSDIADQGA